MFETLYKTDSPKNFANGEYYQIHLDFQIHRDTGKQVFFVREKHGYFDNQKRRMVHSISTLDPDFSEGLTNFQEAQEKYERQLQHRASEGFVHAFSIDPFTGIQYRRLDRKAAMRGPDN